MVAQKCTQRLCIFQTKYNNRTVVVENLNTRRKGEQRLHMKCTQRLMEKSKKKEHVNPAQQSIADMWAIGKHFLCSVESKDAS